MMKGVAKGGKGRPNPNAEMRQGSISIERKCSGMSMRETLVNPVGFFEATNPEAFELLPGGPADLKPEIDLMIAMADQQGLPYRKSDNLHEVMVPMSVCCGVLDTDHYVDDIKEELELSRADGFAYVRAASA